MGMMLPPRAQISAPLTFQRNVRLPLPSTPASAAGSASSAVTRKPVLKPTARASACGAAPAASAVHVADTAYCACAPMPTGHQRFTSLALSVTVADEVPAGSASARTTGAGSHAAATESAPRTGAAPGTSKKARTSTCHGPLVPSARGAVGYAPSKKTSGVTAVRMAPAGATGSR